MSTSGSCSPGSYSKTIRRPSRLESPEDAKSVSTAATDALTPLSMASSSSFSSPTPRRSPLTTASVSEGGATASYVEVYLEEEESTPLSTAASTPTWKSARFLQDDDEEITAATVSRQRRKSTASTASNNSGSAVLSTRRRPRRSSRTFRHYSRLHQSLNLEVGTKPLVFNKCAKVIVHSMTPALSSSDEESSRPSSPLLLHLQSEDSFKKKRFIKHLALPTHRLFWILCWVGIASLAFIVWTTRQMTNERELHQQQQLLLDIVPRANSLAQPAGGLRGKLVKDVGRKTHKQHTPATSNTAAKSKQTTPRKHTITPTKKKKKNKEKNKLTSSAQQQQQQQQPPTRILPPVALPPPLSSSHSKHSSYSVFQDYNRFKSVSKNKDESARRVVQLDEHHHAYKHRTVQVYPADFTDNTQLYSILDSSDERLKKMELREPYVQGECVPMQDWQTTFHPLCNGMHELGIDYLGNDHYTQTHVQLFGTKGFWRNAWKLDQDTVTGRDTVVLKTLKFQHNFEDAHYEHDRIDAVAMERLTSSPHVINVFGFCGHSVLTEYADVSRVGELADKSRKKPLARLRIARDIANGLADVHGIDGDGNATFVHLDINPANVVSIGGTLKLNDFNIGIIRRWNTTSNTPCGFPTQYPNPQWRSPEEARNEQDLTEKVDVFSMGHIFFRLICGHEPWNKLEPGGKPAKQVISEKVKKGVLPFIPDHVRNTTDAEVAAIRDAMLRCYTFDPLLRPSAREIANSLEETLVRLETTQTT